MDDLFRALADPIRLRILTRLARAGQPCCPDSGPVCACDLETLLSLSQPTVSHHMKCLAQAGLVRAEKRGRWVYYTLNPDRFAEARAFLEEFLAPPSPRAAAA